MHDFELQFNTNKLKPGTKVETVAVLENKYFLRSQQGKYFLWDEEKNRTEEVSEASVASAIIKHGYKPMADGESFEFGQRKQILK